MSVFIEKEIVSWGGWQLSKFETVQNFANEALAHIFLEHGKYKLVIDNEFDKFWHEKAKWNQCRYRIKKHTNS